MAGGWNEMSFRVPFNPSHSMILHFVHSEGRFVCTSLENKVVEAHASKTAMPLFAAGTKQEKRILDVIIFPRVSFLNTRQMGRDLTK